MLNDQRKKRNGISWTDWTWNPISGCLHGCPYCYMRRMEKRFPGIMMPKFKPEYMERFRHVRKVKPGDKVFVGSSGDMWGSWVPPRWIADVVNTCALKPKNTFQFLTKNPARYKGWAFSENMWFGTTVDGTAMTKENVFNLLKNVSPYRIRFVSFEPLLDFPAFGSHVFANLDWIIIGADSTRGAKKPPKEWARALIKMARRHDVPVWVKDNYGYPEIIKEFPKAKGGVE